MKRLPVIIVCSFLSYHLQAQQQAGAGSVAFTSGDYGTALQQWQALADQGNSQAAYNVAIIYDRGLGVDRNADEVDKWLQKSAELGDVRAEHTLGDRAYEKKDYADAKKWYEMAAQAGSADAQFDLGLMYDLGQGVPQDFAQALSWYQKAAEKRNASAIRNIAVLYYNGQGVKIDRVQAHRYFLIADQLGDPRAKDLMKFSEDKLTKKQIDQARATANTWLQEHANTMHAGA